LTKELRFELGKKIRDLGSNLLVETSSHSSKSANTYIIEDDKYNQMTAAVEKLTSLVEKLNAKIEKMSRKSGKSKDKDKGRRKGPWRPFEEDDISDSDETSDIDDDDLHGGGDMDDGDDVYVGLEDIGVGH